MSIYENSPKGTHIEIPAIRFLYYVIANTLHACGKLTTVNEVGMIISPKLVFLTAMWRQT
jgi:hypothetical protein